MTVAHTAVVARIIIASSVQEGTRASQRIAGMTIALVDSRVVAGRACATTLYRGALFRSHSMFVPLYKKHLPACLQALSGRFSVAEIRLKLGNLKCVKKC